MLYCFFKASLWLSEAETQKAAIGYIVHFWPSLIVQYKLADGISIKTAV